MHTWNLLPEAGFLLQDGIEGHHHREGQQAEAEHVSAGQQQNFVQSEAETPNNSIDIRLDFLKCVQIFLSSKTPICTWCLNLCTDLR